MSEAKRNYYLSCDKDLPSILPDNKLVNHVNSASNYIKELEEQIKDDEVIMGELSCEIKEYLKLLEYCCFNEDFDADLVLFKIEQITRKPIEEVFKDE